MKRGQTNQTKDGPGFLIFILDKQENSQVGLVPSNYLQELSQFLTQDVNSGRNGSEGPVRTFSLLIPDICHFFTQSNFLENEIYTEKPPIFRAKSVKKNANFLR